MVARPFAKPIKRQGILPAHEQEPGETEFAGL